MICLMPGDCLDVLPLVADGSVDMILADPPYEKTPHAWDKLIPFKPLWAQLERILKPRGAVVMTAGQPFTSALVMSNIEWFKYCWVWEKKRSSGFAQAKNKPLSSHEDICVFSPGATIHACQSERRMNYHPQGLKPFGKVVRNSTKKSQRTAVFTPRDNARNEYLQEYTNYPKSVINFGSDVGLHPTQKPVALMEYLIKTYTLPGQLVLDFSMGSGTTGVACVNLGRQFIGIEKDMEIFKTASKRIDGVVNSC